MMKKFNLSLGPIATASLGLVLVILVLNSVVVHQNAVGVNVTQDSINREFDALIQTQETFALYKDAEAQTWAYVINGDKTNLDNFRRISEHIEQNDRLLSESISGDPRLKQRLTELLSQIHGRLSSLRGILERPETNRKEAARDFLLAEKMSDDTERIQAIANEIEMEEIRLRGARTRDQYNGLFMVLTANWVTVIVGVVITVLAWFLVERELHMRREAEAITHFEHQNLLVTLQSIDDGVIVADAKGLIKLVNPSAQELIGNPRVISGRTLPSLFSIVDELTREPIENPVNQILSQGKVSANLSRAILIRADGTEIPIEQSAAPIHDASGSITGVVFVFHDCSVQRKFEKEMKERARRFRRVFETPLIGVAVGNTQGDLLEANDAFLELIGHPTGDPVQNPRSWDGIPMLQIPLDEAAQAELQEKGVCKPFEKIYSRQDGKRVPVLVSAARLQDDQDRIVVFVTDLSQTKRAEAALLESEARFRVLSECMPQKVWTAKPDGRIDYVNHMLLDYCGIPAEELKEWGWNSLIHPVDAQIQSDAWRQSLSNRNMFEIELRFRDHAGEYRWHLARALPVYRPDGQIAMWVGTYTDIHNQKQAEEALREEHRRKDEFLALLAHELRNPLAPLSNAIQVFSSIQSDAPHTDELLNIMRRQVRQMTRLIDDLLDLGRITTGRMRLRCERITVGSVVAAAVEAVQPLISERQHELKASVPDEDLWLDADSARLSQVLTNLLHNAAKFTSPHGQLRLSVEKSGTDAVIRVGDNGPGIPHNMLTRVFDLFTQADFTLDRTHGGLGIGLTLVRRLVELHGGTVKAMSNGLGQGSEFIVRLPLTSLPPIPSIDNNSDEGTQSNQSQLPVLKILVVDDVQASAKTLAMLLTTLGQKVQMAFDGPSAISRAAEMSFDLIFLDIAMPEMDGLEVARHLRANPELASTTLIALTGFGQEEDRTKSLKAGFNEHLTKPLSLDQLRDILRSSAEKNHRSEERAERGNFNATSLPQLEIPQQAQAGATSASLLE